MTDQHNPDQPATCQVCHRRVPTHGRQVCGPCIDSITTDLETFGELAALLPAAVAPNLAQPLTIGSRSSDVAMPGGDALNLTAASNSDVPVRLIPHVRTVREVELLEVPGYQPVEHTEFRREPVLDTDGAPELIPDGDQCGPLGPWVMIGRWVADWARLRDVGETGHTDPLWLLERLDWACRAHPNIGGWVGELRATVGGMRAVLGLRRHVVRYGDRCPGMTAAGVRCNTPGSLYRWIDPVLPEDDRRVRYVNCGVCGTMFDLDDERINGGSRVA